VALTTGNLAIDYLTGIGGLPQGRITELYGMPSSGKTTTALQAAANLQRRIIADGTDERISTSTSSTPWTSTTPPDLGIDLEHPSRGGSATALARTGRRSRHRADRHRQVPHDHLGLGRRDGPKRLIDGGFDQATSRDAPGQAACRAHADPGSLLHQRTAPGSSSTT
jgi:hypothetical protein